jgi:hypothetical protein
MLNFWAVETVFTGTQTQDRFFRVCGPCSCNLLETNFGLSTVLLLCSVLDLLQPPLPGRKAMTLRFFSFTVFRTYVHACTNTYTHVHADLMYIHTQRRHPHIRTCVRVCMRTYIHMYVRTHAHITLHYICTYVGMYLHSYTGTVLYVGWKQFLASPRYIGGRTLPQFVQWQGKDLVTNSPAMFYQVLKYIINCL